ncbi:MAG: transcriptional regulator [Verrucomicrobiaceae bacterium]|nr:transcriptional regulator [Verrucomicrobiaceae bacterium]
MTATIKTNKQGQELGPKGRSTRQRLMSATERLLKTSSPVELTAVSIAKEAEMSSAAFYLYFEDVRNVLHALSVAAAAEMAEVHAILAEPWNPQEPDIKHAMRVVQAFYKVYDKHRAVLRFCNLEADRGDADFDKIRLGMLIPFFEQFSGRIFEAASENGSRYSRGDAYAEAITLVAALERNASSDPARVQNAIGTKRLQEAMARLIAWRFSKDSLTVRKLDSSEAESSSDKESNSASAKTPKKTAKKAVPLKTPKISSK